jgi:hypothetical protein
VTRYNAGRGAAVLLSKGLAESAHLIQAILDSILLLFSVDRSSAFKQIQELRQRLIFVPVSACQHGLKASTSPNCHDHDVSQNLYLSGSVECERVGARTRRMRVAMQTACHCNEYTNSTQGDCAKEHKRVHTLIIVVFPSFASSMQKGFVAEHWVCSIAWICAHNSGSCLAP